MRKLSDVGLAEEKFEKAEYLIGMARTPEAAFVHGPWGVQINQTSVLDKKRAAAFVQDLVTRKTERGESTPVWLLQKVCEEITLATSDPSFTHAISEEKKDKGWEERARKLWGLDKEDELLPGAEIRDPENEEEAKAMVSILQNGGLRLWAKEILKIYGTLIMAGG